MADTFHNRHFNSIQALRGFTALFVALEHVRFLSCGAFGVDIFFIVSGFMAMFATHQSTEHFIKKRLIRIYPLYALITLGTFFVLLLFPNLFHLTQAEPAQLVKSLFFIPFEISEGVIQPLVRVGWTINYEMLFYLLFALSFRVSHKYRGLICSGFLSLLVFAGHFISIDSTILTFYGDYIQLEFILGIIIYYTVRKLYELCEGKSFSSILSYICISLVLIVFLILAITKQQTDITGIGRVLYWGLPAFVIILFTFIIDINIKVPKFMVHLGNMSFSIYLIHYYPIMFIDRQVYSLEFFTPMALLATIIGFSIVIILSFISYQLIEQRLSRYLRVFFK